MKDCVYLSPWGIMIMSILITYLYMLYKQREIRLENIEMKKSIREMYNRGNEIIQDKYKYKNCFKRALKLIRK